MKFCGLCKANKPLTDFGTDKRNKSGLRSGCKLCRKREYDYEKKSTYNKVLYQKNREKVIKQSREYTLNHLEENKIYKNNYEKTRAQNSIAYRIKKNLRARLRGAIKNNIKQGSSINDLGCSVDFLKQYLTSKFYNEMNWNNYGSGPGHWQIDHIKALRLFDLTDRNQLLEACHYTNLQPLWHKEHVIKTLTDRRL